MARMISVVTPCYNEAENLEELHARVAAVMAQLPFEYEHIVIDNHSTDASPVLLTELATQDKHLKVIFNARNFGHIRSPYHGLMQASGDAVILIASDLQDPPELIPQFIRLWEEGAKTVLAVKPTSQEPRIMFALRRAYYRLVSRISDVDLIQNATGAGLYDRAVIEVLRGLRDPYPYLRGLSAEIGLKVATVPFEQPRRVRGITKNNFYTLFDMAMLGVTSHSKVPLRIMTLAGFCLSFLGGLTGFAYLLAKLLFWDTFAVGTAPVLIGVFFFGALQMMMIGILGEYIGAILTQVRGLPHVVEERRLNL